MLLEHKVWDEKYRPKKLEDCVLPDQTRLELQQIIDSGDLPNLLLCGPAGIGKTTVAMILVNAIDAEFIKINGSLNGNIDTLRNEIQQFAATVSLNGNKKYVILDEADNLSHATQMALRGFTDEFSTNCGFIFTCNFREKIIDPLAESRLTEVSFTFSESERMSLAKQLLPLLTRILDAEKIKYEINDVKKLIVEQLTFSFDVRRMILLAQKYSKSGTLVLGVDVGDRFGPLEDAIKTKNFRNAREWIGRCSDIDPAVIYRYIYDNATTFAPKKLEPALVLILAKYQEMQSRVADREINLAAMVVEIMTIETDNR